jgi:glycosyltransferase involved in cell wall biosynthesis
MRLLILSPYPHGAAPSQRFRFEHYLPYLAEAGIGYKQLGFWDEETNAILYKPGLVFKKMLGLAWGYARRVGMLWTATRYDYVLIHREVTPLGPPIFEFLLSRLLRKKIIYDFDDAIWLPNTSENNKIASGLKWHGKVRSICKWAYKITPGNAYLADFARQYNKKVEVLPTVVDTKYHHASKKSGNSVLVIGWTGSHSTLPYLEPLVPVLRQLEQLYAFRFLVIADKNPNLPLDSFEFLPWNKNSEIEDLGRIDVGVMPLLDDQWAAGKCGFKAIQYLALGIPALVSPVGVNTQIVADGVNGYHCQSAADWYNNLEQLLRQPALLTTMRQAAIEQIENQYSVKSSLAQFINLFK